MYLPGASVLLRAGRRDKLKQVKSPVVRSNFLGLRHWGKSLTTPALHEGVSRGLTYEAHVWWWREAWTSAMPCGRCAKRVLWDRAGC